MRASGGVQDIMNNREVVLLSCFLLCAGAFELSGKDILIQGNISGNSLTVYRLKIGVNTHYRGSSA